MVHKVVNFVKKLYFCSRKKDTIGIYPYYIKADILFNRKINNNNKNNMREFQSEDDLQGFLERGDFYEEDFTIYRKCYLLICEEKNDATFTLFTDKEFDAYMNENVCVSDRDLVEKMVYQIGKPCAVTLEMYTVGGNSLDKDRCIWGHGKMWRGVFSVDIEE